MLLGMHSSGMAFRASNSASSQLHLVFYDATAVCSLLLPSTRRPDSYRFPFVPNLSGAQLRYTAVGELALMYIIMAAVCEIECP
jgi:hypothetical protein